MFELISPKLGHVYTWAWDILIRSIGHGRRRHNRRRKPSTSIYLFNNIGNFMLQSRGGFTTYVNANSRGFSATTKFLRWHFTHTHWMFMRGNAFGCICLSLWVFLYVCPVRAIAFRCFDLQTLLSVRRYNFRTSRLMPSIKVIGSRSRSYERN